MKTTDSRSPALLLVLPALAAALAFAGQATAATNVAVFNFQLQTGQEDWVWLEKFMADQMATDLVQDRSLSVVARDRMQLLAQQYRWVPEFATENAKVMGAVRSRLKIEYLVTGVCRVTGEKLEITGQVVEVGSRKEVFRKTVRGKADEVIDLQKQLSAEVMAWLTHKKAADILKTLPVWTRSIPAVRALYEGMHLYDQGRYAEGWLKFRRSSRADRNYVEAVYWVGKMYYFLYRYGHARRTLEKFVYLDCLHPRMGDAMMEYVHTFESGDASPDDLLSLYAAFGQRFPTVPCGRLHRDRLASGGIGSYYEEGTDISRLTGSDWARYKSAMLLAQTGREADAAVLTGPATATAGLATLPPDGILHLLAGHARTGFVPADNVIAYAHWPRVRQTMLRFVRGNARRQYLLPEPETILGPAAKSSDKFSVFWADKCRFSLYLLAPSGCVFRSLRFDPVAEGRDANLAVSLSPVGFHLPIDEPKVVPLAAARDRGLTLDRVPSSGMLMARLAFRCRGDSARPVTVRGVNVTAELERIERPGSLDVQCRDTHHFRVNVDGAFGRWWPGLVGPLKPGKHTVTFHPLTVGSPQVEWTTTVTVRPGKTTRVVGRLPWKGTDDVETAWVGRDYDSPNLALNENVTAPALLVDDKAIRLVWSRGGDLWSSVSTDGKTYSRPRKLPLPVSTAWLESDPRLMRDESGRFSLSFVSDRDEQHRRLVYLCWSRDFVHWSAPCIVSDIAPCEYDLSQAPSGDYVCVMTLLKGRPEGDAARAADQITGRQHVMSNFELPGDRPPEGLVGRTEVLILDSNDGYAWSTRSRVDGEESSLRFCRDASGDEHLYGFHIDSEQTSGQAEGIMDYPSWEDRYATTMPLSACAAVGPSGTITLLGSYDEKSFGGGTRLLFPVDGHERSSRYVPGLARGYSAIGYSPRWGYVLAWTSARFFEWLPHGHAGPYVLRCLDLPKRMTEAAREARSARAAAPPDREIWTRRFRESGSTKFTSTVMGDKSGSTWKLAFHDAQGKLKSATVKAYPKPRKPRKPAPGADALGRLTYRGWVGDFAWGSNFRTVRSADANKSAAPAASAPTGRRFNFSVDANTVKLAVLLESTSSRGPHYDIARVYDPAWQSAQDGGVLHRDRIAYSAAARRWTSHFAGRFRLRNSEDRVVPFAIDVTVVEGRTIEAFTRVGALAEGRCAFGDKVHRVTLYDTNANLRVDDKPRADGKGGFDYVIVELDGWQAGNSYGRPLLVDGTLYDLAVSEDGNTVTARRYTGPTGRIQTPHPWWSGVLTASGVRMWIRGGRDPVPVPAGRFHLHGYTEYTGSNYGRTGPRLKAEESVTRATWETTAVIKLPPAPPVEVRPGQTSRPDIGSPIVGKLRADGAAGGAVTFGYTEANRAGQCVTSVLVTPDSIIQRRDAVIDIAAPDGRPIDTVPLRWTPVDTGNAEEVTASGLGSWHATWKPPAGSTGPFTATVQRDAGPFEVRAKPVTFSVR